MFVLYLWTFKLRRIAQDNRSCYETDPLTHICCLLHLFAVYPGKGMCTDVHQHGTYLWKLPNWKGKSSSKPSFGGFQMLIFQAVYIFVHTSSCIPRSGRCSPKGLAQHASRQGESCHVEKPWDNELDDQNPMDFWYELLIRIKLFIVQGTTFRCCSITMAATNEKHEHQQHTCQR